MVHFFQKKTVGVSISDNAIEVVELVHDGAFKISSRGRVELETGVIVKGRISDSLKLTASFRELFRNVEFPHEIICGLPEAQTFLSIYESEDMSKESITRAVYQNIPLEKENIIFSYAVGRDEKEKKRVLVIAASRVVLSEWNNFFISLGIEVKFFDSEALAIVRNVFSSRPKDPACIVRSDAFLTMILVCDEYGLAYAYSLRTTGDTTMIVREIRGAFDYYRHREQKDIHALVLVGSLSRTSGFKDYMEKNMGIPAKSDLPETVDLAALGIAMRGFEEGDPVLTIEGAARHHSQKMPIAGLVAIATLSVAIVLVTVLIIWALVLW